MIDDKTLQELRRLAEGMATGEYVADPSPYHAELLTELLDEVASLRAALSGRPDLDHPVCVCGRMMLESRSIPPGRNGAIRAWDCVCGHPEFRDELDTLRGIVRDLAASEPRDFQARDGYDICLYCSAEEDHETWQIPHTETCLHLRAVEAVKP